MEIGKEWKKFTEKVKPVMKLDKYGRAKECFEVLKEEELCRSDGTKILSYNEISDTGIGNWKDNIRSSDKYTYCIPKFQEKGITLCNNLPGFKAAPSPEATFVNDINSFKAAAESSAAILQVHYDGGEIVAIPNTPGDDNVSIGKATKLNGKEINGCKFVVRDFFEGKAILDFSNFPDATFEDLFITNIKMNELATKAIHLADVSPEYLVCLYNYSGSLVEDSFIFNSQENMHA
ncbi:hypothetical protein H1Q59_04955 [Holosporaceae bacterium 'Namur']|nr:hypothetical protein [Holosporaceae bacterium 'Namur']